MSASVLTNSSRTSWSGIKIHTGLIVLTILLAMWNSPIPEGLTPQTWHLFAVFISTIVGIILKPLPTGALAFISIAICVITDTLTIEQSLSSFSSGTVWLILLAFLLARGFTKTGLGSRLAYYVVYFFGKSTLGLSYSFVATEFLLAPFIPSNTARGAGIVFPIASSLSREFGSTPEDGTHNKIGAFLLSVCFHAGVITSSMFMTAMAANPLIAIYAAELGVNLTWGTWAKATIVPGLISLLVLPFVVNMMNPPEIKKTPEAQALAKQRLKEMGKFSFHELFMIGTFILLLVLWIFGGNYGINATTSAFLGLSLLLMSGVLNWDDILAEKNAWDTFIWLSTLLTMTLFLAKFGMMTWFGEKMQLMVSGYSAYTSLGLLLLVYFYSHYIFASLTAHVTSMYTAFTVVAITAGVPPMLAILSFAISSNLCACMTHYGTATAPVYYGARYIPFSKWWGIGAVMSIVHILIWSTAGLIWWKLIGIW